MATKSTTTTKSTTKSTPRPKTTTERRSAAAAKGAATRKSAKVVREAQARAGAPRSVQQREADAKTTAKKSPAKAPAKKDAAPAPMKSTAPKGHPGHTWAKLLDAANLSQTKAANDMGVAPMTLNRLVNGHGIPTAKVTVLFAKTVGANPEELWTEVAAYELAQALKGK